MHKKLPTREIRTRILTLRYVRLLESIRKLAGKKKESPVNAPHLLITP